MSYRRRIWSKRPQITPPGENHILSRFLSLSRGWLAACLLAMAVCSPAHAQEANELQVLTVPFLEPAVDMMNRMFQPREKVVVKMQAERPELLISLANGVGAGDVLALVSDSVMDEAELAGAIRPETRTLVGSTRLVLLVPKGNPLKIHGVEDLARPGVRVGVSTHACLAGAWEDVMVKAGVEVAESANKNVVLRPPGCKYLVSALIAGKIDAGFGWPFLVVKNPKELDAIPLPPYLEIRRGVSMAVTKGAKNPELALRFIEYAKSHQGQAALQWWEGQAPTMRSAPENSSGTASK